MITPLTTLPEAPSQTIAESQEIGAEPDVTWGDGGIDDWGWTAWPRSAVVRCEEPEPVDAA
jgi:hypothetical protein